MRAQSLNTSLIAAPGKVPVAGANGMLDQSWTAGALAQAKINDIGLQGFAGFGVGLCPALPAGFTPLPGCSDKLSENFGNYQYSDGSIMVWIPAFYMRLAHASNSTYAAYGVNSIEVRGMAAFPDEATANADSFYLHRAFINAGANQLGFFRDKYDCSLNGTTASSIKGVQPMVSGPVAGQVGFSGCTANGQTPPNYHAGSIAASKSRGSKFVPETVFMADALTRLSEAHAQSSKSSTYCAWWSSGLTNFPKGNNNNALKDSNDNGVTFTGAGNATYPTFALAGSGVPFAKTTHNGQACGVADVNGNIYKINIGMTCIVTSKTITAATKTNPVTVTATAHGLTTGATVLIDGVIGMTQLNQRIYVVEVTDANTLTLTGVDGTAYGTYTSGGSVASGKFYSLKPSVNVETLTAGNALATDAWGATGVAANYDEISLNLVTTPASNTSNQRYGNAAAQVFGWSTATERTMSMLGMPASGGTSTAGTAAFGNDLWFQYIRNELCVISRGYWNDGGYAGVRFRLLSHARTYAHSYVGFAASRYL
jgi:hypothetical protein